LVGRILITGVSSDLGADLARRLNEASKPGQLIGLDLEPPPYRLRQMRFVKADLRHPNASEVVRRLDPDVVIHLALRVSSATTDSRLAHELNVSGTMNVLAGARSARRIVLKSSTAVYASGQRMPSLLREEDAGRFPPPGPGGRDLLEVESLLNDHYLASPDLTVTVLRLGHRLGSRRSRRSPLADYLALPRPPTVAGFNPRVQLLAEEDAVESLHRAALADHPGTFNVTGRGAILLSRLLQIAGRSPAPLLPPVGGRFLQAQAYRAITGHIPHEYLLELVTGGQVADSALLLQEFGWQPPRSSREVAGAFFDLPSELARAG
jgi:UDP-glucose 4-epimerase